MSRYGFTTIADTYNHFETLYGAEEPERTLEELRDLIHACDLRYENIDSRFWDAAFDSGWCLDPEKFNAAVALYATLPMPSDDDA